MQELQEGASEATSKHRHKHTKQQFSNNAKHRATQQWRSVFIGDRFLLIHHILIHTSLFDRGGGYFSSMTSIHPEQADDAVPVCFVAVCHPRSLLFCSLRKASSVHQQPDEIRLVILVVHPSDSRPRTCASSQCEPRHAVLRCFLFCQSTKTFTLP